MIERHELNTPMEKNKADFADIVGVPIASLPLKGEGFRDT